MNILREFQLTMESGLPGDKLNKFEILSRLNSLNSLAEGWNGYEAAPINPIIIKAAERFISALPSNIVSSPQVVPMTRGRVQFEWHRGDRSLELEFESPVLLHYLKSDSNVGMEEEDIISIEQQNKILDLLKWFAAQ